MRKWHLHVGPFYTNLFSEIFDSLVLYTSMHSTSIPFLGSNHSELRPFFLATTLNRRFLIQQYRKRAHILQMWLRTQLRPAQVAQVSFSVSQIWFSWSDKTSLLKVINFLINRTYAQPKQLVLWCILFLLLLFYYNSFIPFIILNQNNFPLNVMIYLSIFHSNAFVLSLCYLEKHAQLIENI